MKKSLILLCLGLGLSWGGESAQSASPVQIKQIFVDTAENSSVKGDAIVIQFNQAMNRSNWVDNRISHTAQNTPKAPAGYTQPANSQSARNAARNYTVKITPRSGSRTAAYTGTWANLGGSAFYDPQDSSLVILVPPSVRSQLFTPGDWVEVTAASSLTNAEGLVIDSARIQHSAPAS